MTRKPIVRLFTILFLLHGINNAKSTHITILKSYQLIKRTNVNSLMYIKGESPYHSDDHEEKIVRKRQLAEEIADEEYLEIEMYTANFTDSLNITQYDQELINKYTVPKTWTWVLIFFHCVVFIIGLMGNVLVCVAVYRNHSMRTVTNYFIVNLAVADALVILFCLPFSVVWDVTSTWWFGTVMCKSVLYIQLLLILGSAGACRREELVNMTIDDVEDNQSMLVIKIPNTKTNHPRSFIVVDEQNLNVYRTYVSLRPSNVPHRRLFIFYNKGKCSIQPVGLHSVGKAPSKIASYLGLSNPEQFTGHCFRRSSATLLVEGGGDILNLKRHGGWKSSQVAEGYIEQSLQNKIDIASKIQEAGGSKVHITSQTTHKDVSKNEAGGSKVHITSQTTHKDVSKNFPSSLQFNNVQNCTFNITVQK